MSDNIESEEIEYDDNGNMGNEKTTENQCPECGRIIENADFCYYCGFSFSGDVQNETEDETGYYDENMQWYNKKTQNPTDVFAFDTSFIDRCFERYYVYTDEDIGDITVNAPAVEMVNPDYVNNIERSKVIAVLDDVKKITRLREDVFNNLAQIDSELAEVRKTATELLYYSPGWFYLVEFGIVILSWVIMLLIPNFFVLCIAVGVTYFAFKGMNDLLVTFICADKNMVTVDYFLQDVLPKLAREKEINLIRLQIINGMKEFQWAVEIVGEEMLHTGAIDMMIGYIKSRRADNVKEALNKYDTDCHEQRMEYMQHEMEIASQIQAMEAQKQTIYAANTAASAASTARSMKNISKSAKSIARSARWSAMKK